MREHITTKQFREILIRRLHETLTEKEKVAAGIVGYTPDLATAINEVALGHLHIGGTALADLVNRHPEKVDDFNVSETSTNEEVGTEYINIVIDCLNEEEAL